MWSLDLLEQGYNVEDALQELLDADPEPETRQIIAVDREGRSAAHTGSETDPWKGHRMGEDYAVAGNMLVGEETITAMVGAFEASSGEPLLERLLTALQAGQAAGGDKRSRQTPRCAS